MQELGKKMKTKTKPKKKVRIRNGNLCCQLEKKKCLSIILLPKSDRKNCLNLSMDMVVVFSWKIM